MRHTDFNMKIHGFVGHMAESESKTDKAVIVIMGGEKSILLGLKIAERFVDFGFCGLSVSLFGAEGLPDGADRIPLDMFENVVRFLKEKKGMKSISTYGVSMGSLFAALTAEYIGGIENVILVSPSHVPFEGTLNKKQLTNHSVVTWHGKELPFVNADFTKYKVMKYHHDCRSKYRVTGMWRSYEDAYSDKMKESEADIIHIEKLNARILLIARTGDEMWPSDYSVRYLEKSLRENHYKREYKAILYKGAGHLLGIMPSHRREPMLYKKIPIIGIFYQRFRDSRSICMDALEKSEREIVEWLVNSGKPKG